MLVLGTNPQLQIAEGGFSSKSVPVLALVWYFPCWYGCCVVVASGSLQSDEGELDSHKINSFSLDERFFLST